MLIRIYSSRASDRSQRNEFGRLSPKNNIRIRLILDAKAVLKRIVPAKPTGERPPRIRVDRNTCLYRRYQFRIISLIGNVTRPATSADVGRLPTDVAGFRRAIR